MGTTEMSRTCMCFPLECAYNEDSDQCEMRTTNTMNASSNPVYELPYTGLKCAEHKGHHWFSHHKECELTACNHVDFSHVGPVDAEGHQLYGRVGRSENW